ncbi:Subtilisin-like protease SBT4.7 [Hyphomicrobium sp. 1Nfss2.1]|uniref:c-type cytochrome n=1 Tax=Hyphomicrobium sp. 1Nfss2.1 TaxID=3413936 RepID=UPI003C7D7106
MQRVVGLLALCLSVLVIPAGAVELGNKEEGHAYAQKFCTECHAIEKDESMLFSEVPSFQEVADSEGMSPRALSVWLRTSHPNMPDFIIPPDDIDNLVAYIMSLRTPKE